MGPIIFGQGANRNIGGFFDLEMLQVCELMRVALRTHQAPVTQILAVALRMMRRDNPGIKLVVSYADPSFGHQGTIYQAGNWIYMGVTNIVPQYYYQGAWVHRRGFSGKAYARASVPPELAKLPKRMRQSKHRYVYPFTKKLRRRLQKQAQPYPRDRSKDSVAPGVQPGEAGAIPSRSLEAKG